MLGQGKHLGTSLRNQGPQAGPHPGLLDILRQLMPAWSPCSIRLNGLWEWGWFAITQLLSFHEMLFLSVLKTRVKETEQKLVSPFARLRTFRKLPGRFQD